MPEKTVVGDALKKVLEDRYHKIATEFENRYKGNHPGEMKWTEANFVKLNHHLRALGATLENLTPDMMRIAYLDAKDRGLLEMNPGSPAPHVATAKPKKSVSEALKAAVLAKS